MKIFRNIPAAVKLYSALKQFNPYKAAIEDAKKKGDYERERENIQAAESIWSKHVMDMFGAQLVVHGKENIPSKGPVVLSEIIRVMRISSLISPPSAHLWPTAM